MRSRNVWWCLTVMAIAAVEARSAAAALPLVLPRPGQIGFSLQGQVSDFVKTGLLGKEFGSGGGIAVRVRYRMRYERALGLSFEAVNLDARAPADSSTARTRLNMLLSGADVYQMFNTDSRTQGMINLSAGLAQVHYSLRDGETEYPNEGDGVYVAAGGGVERFFYRSLAFDLSARYLAVVHGGKTNHGLNASAGLIFYASY
ncbi:MAG TPA: hypothetical protein VL123_01265 [Candidatus Udaeobacter sp.]|jgi:hypothetical protein|nr:hypothetical protein [Candidatus Udaeobacter sp.]